MTDPTDGDTPIVVSATMAANAQRWLDGWRREFFPPHRNVLAAHLTMFHAVPGAHAAELLAELQPAAATMHSVSARVTGLLFLGRGVAVGLSCPELETLRSAVAAALRPWLTSQDAQRWRAHVTVQNKVDPAVAKATLAQLSTRALPERIGIDGVQLSRYVGGAWEPWVALPFG